MKQLNFFLLLIFFSSLSAQLTDLTPNDLEDGDLFGFFVEMNGNDLILSSQGSNDLFENSGAVYYYSYQGTAWELQQKIIPEQADAENHLLMMRTTLIQSYSTRKRIMNGYDIQGLITTYLMLLLAGR